jgi:hypothetical protein
VYVEDVLLVDLPSRAKWLTEEGDILVGNVRPGRGIIGVVTKRSAGALASSGFTLVRASSASTLPGGFLFAYLRTDFARIQMVRRESGSMYPAVRPSDVLDICVPLPTERLAQLTDDLVQEACDLQDKFFESYDALTKMVMGMVESLGPVPDPVKASGRRVNIASVRWSECFGSGSAHRLDAEFFRADYAAYQSDLESGWECFLVGTHYTATTGRLRKPGTDLTPTLKQAVLTNAGVNWSAVVDEASDGGELRPVRSGDILLAATAHEIPYIGRKVDYVREVPEKLREQNQAVAELMILRPRTSKPANVYGSYVAAFLRSPSGRHQVQRCIRGLRGGHVYPDDVRNRVVVPLPDDQWLNQFEQKAREAEEHRLAAKNKIARAVSEVDAWLHTG